MKLLVLALLYATSLTAQKTKAPPVLKGPSAFDKVQLESYVRHLFVWPEDIKIAIGDPQPSPIPGFQQVTVHASKDQASQDEIFYIARNGRQILQASLYDIAENPYRDNLAKLKPAGDPSLGTPGAPVVLVEFSDFQCHFCQEESKIIRENLLTEYPTQVHFYFVDFPLSAIHPWARAAAVAGRCVFRQDPEAFWKYHDWIFASQEKIQPDVTTQVMDWAKENGLDSGKLAACMDDNATQGEIDASLAMGKSLNVAATPTIFINGRPMAGATPWPELKRVIDFEIGYQQTAHNAGENCGCDLTLKKTGVK